MSKKFLPLQALFTPIAASGLFLASWHLCVSGGLWLVLPIAWTLVFFLLGLSGAHGLFYICMLPLPQSEQPRPAFLRWLQAFWFMQVPFAPFNGVYFPYSIFLTQGVLIILALVCAQVSGYEKEPAQTPN